ncbi:hypothetical protein B0H13DRAFT_1904565 [Mycena leptocephala]|nr:hypothetical protein B0H13DRAFT_1904565 [Mycena leptocephala]
MVEDVPVFLLKKYACESYGNGPGYPFIQFYSVIVLPHTFWIFNVEIGLRILSTRWHFTATYGQLLAIFVTVPPFIQLCLILPRIPPWFADLAWVRLLTGRRNQPFVGVRPTDESALPMQQDPRMMASGKPEGLPEELEPLQMHKLDPNKARSAASSRSGSYMDI